MDRVEARSVQLEAHEPMHIAPEAIKSRGTGVATPTLLTNFPAKNGGAAEANQ